MDDAKRTEGWQAYYRAVKGNPPRPTLKQALDAFEAEGRQPGVAVDLGCGAGTDTAELLARGWRVLAVDRESSAIELLRERVGEQNDRLQTLVAPFGEFGVPACDLVNASLSLPFCPPHAFPGLWEQITRALSPGGRFSGHFFGPNDTWARNPELTILHRDDLLALLRDFEAELFQEREYDGTNALGDPKHWHVFEVVARRTRS